MKNAPIRILRAAVPALALLLVGQVKAGLLGYWNFDGPPATTASERLKDLSGNNYHGNDRNSATAATRVLFNNYDVPRAPFLTPPGNTNYCLDLTGANRFVVMEGATGIAAAGAVTTAGNAFNIGNSNAASVPGSAGKLTVSFWWKGVSPNSWGDAVTKGGETYAPRGLQGWSVRRNAANNYFAFTARGLIGDSPAGMDYAARSGGTLAAPTIYDPATRTSAAPAGAVIYSDSIAGGAWQHATCVWDGRWLHHYVNGFQIRSVEVAAGTNYVGTNSLLSFGQNMIADTNAVFGTVRYGQLRMDEIAIFDEALTPGAIEDLARGADPRKPMRSSILPFDFAWPAPSPGAVFSTGVPTALPYAPVAEQVFNLIDGLPPLPATTPYTKWLSYAGRTAGFIVTPAASSTVQSFTMITGNDADTRDPASYELYGTNSPISSLANSDGTAESWTLISSGALSLPAGRTTAVPAVGFANATAYTSYKMVFPSLKNTTTETLFQLTEIQFYPNTDGTGSAILAPANAIKAIAKIAMPPVSAGAPAAGYVSGAIIPQGGPGTVGLFEMRANGNLKRYEGITITNAIVYANEAPILFARWGCINNPTGTYGVAPYPFARSTTGTIIDYGDDNASIATGHNTIQTEMLTSTVGTAHDHFFQMIQGCLRVTAAGRYTFTMRGDDGAQLAIAGATWVNRYADNGNGSYTGELLQNGFPTADTLGIGVVEFPAAGDYNFRYQWNEQGGGAWDEVLYAPGEISAYNPTDFRQIGNPAGGLTLVDHKPIVDIRSSSLLVLAGAPVSVTLDWDAAYATTVTLDGGVFSNQNMTAGTLNGYGATTIAAPTMTTTYTITCDRNGGTPVVDTVTIFVDVPPVMFTLAADDNTLVAGAPMTLRWTGIGVLGSPSSFSLSDGVTPMDVTANTTGSAFVLQRGVITLPAPAVTTTYSISGLNPNGASNVVQATVTIATPPVLSLTADKSSMLQGSYVTLNWTVSDATTASITPRLNNSSISNSVAFAGTSVEQPQRTTTYVLSGTNIYGTATASVTVTLPERFGISPAGWTVQVDFWNRFGYLDPVYGNRTAHNSGIYQSEEMFAISDATLGDRGPLAASNISATIPTMTGPAVPPTAQPGNTNKVLMRYRQTGVAVVNYDDALTSGGSLFGGEVRPPPSNTTVGGAGVTFDQYSLKATATLVVNAPGGYTLGMNNDDGGRLRIDLNSDGDFLDSGETLVQDETYHGFLGSLPLTGTVELQAGTYPIEYIYFEGAGGSGGEVFFVDAADGCIVKPVPVVTSSPSAPAGTDVVISEFMAVNTKSLDDGEGSTPDWIELYNGTAGPISLSGYYLTDNAGVPNKWAFPGSASIPAGGYVIVFASGKANRIPPPPVTEFHTNFTLGGGTGYVALKKDDGGGGYLNVSSFSYPNQRADVSYGWYDGTNIGFSATPTPGKLNMGGAASLVNGDTHFDVDRGIKTAAFNLTITADDVTAGTVIRYTTDGSTPTELNGSTYGGAIPISVTTVIRARAMRTGAIPTNTDTQTYLFLDDVLTQNTVLAVSKGWPNSTVSGQYFDFGMDSAIVSGREAEVKTALQAIPTVSVVTDITNFTDPTCGIFVESQFRGRAYERNCSVELLNDTGDLNGNFQIEAGIRSRGGFSRNDGNPKHSWHLYFRNDPGYGGRLRYSVFGAAGTNRFEQIDLATANNYSWSYAPEAGNIRNFTYTNNTNTSTVFPWRYNTFVRDPASRDLQITASGYGTRDKYVHLYLNGIYWGVHYFQERAESSFAEQYFGGNKDNYDVVKSSGSVNGYQTEATDGDNTRGITGTATVDGTYVSDWNKLYGGAFDLRNRNGTALTAAAINDRNVRFYKLMGMDYNPGTQTAVRNPALPVLLDVNSLVDYIIITFYTGAYDAPLSTFLNNSSNNWIALRDRTSQQGFRYFVWDFEHGMGTDMLSGDIGAAGILQDTDYSAGTNNKFVFSPVANTVTAGVRSTNRLGPWAIGSSNIGPNPRVLWPTNQQFRGAFSATNPEIYNNSYLYNNGNDLARTNPQYLHEFLAYSSEYRRMFGDRANCLLRQNGPLTTASVLASVDARKAQLENAIIAESARWGNAKGVALANYDKNAWLGGVQNIKDWVTQGSNQHVLNSLPIYEAGGVTPRVGTGVAGPGRAEVLISQLRAYKDGGNGGGFFIVTTKALTTNVATLTVQTTPAHTVTVGQSIVVRLSAADAVFDGAYTVTATTATTISYARTNANVTSVATSGSVTLPNIQVNAPGYVVPSLFPGLDAPTLSSYGGVVAVNTNITLTNPNAGNTNQTVYYSTSGADPRPLGGGAPSGATSIGPNGTVSGPATLTTTGTLLARVYDSVTGEWSATGKADFVVGVPASAANTVITEINYNPRDLTPGTPTGGDIQTFEFIELMNSSAGPVDFSGVKFTTGIAYTFPTGRVLAAGERMVIAKDLTAFASRYPDGSYAGLSAKTVGPFDGQLDNGGERIVLTALNNTTIADLTYDDAAPWPTTPDGATGNGATLVFRTACGNTTAAYGEGVSWYGHQTVRGNPGGPDGDAYASWAATNGVSSDGEGDSDNDGIADLVEYLLGSNPSTASSVTLLPTAGTADFTVGMTTDTYQTLTYLRRIDLPDVTSTVEVCDDLAAANWTASAVFVSRTDNGNGTETLIYRAPLPISGDNRNFMRVHIICDPIP